MLLGLGLMVFVSLATDQVSNVLDTPELFWSEASLKNLYDAVREYMEIESRVQRVNEKLAVASEFVRSFVLTFRFLA